VDRLSRVTGLRLVLALLIVLMTATITPAVANEDGSGTPPDKAQAGETPPDGTGDTSTEVPTQVPTDVPATVAPTEVPATVEPTEAPATAEPTAEATEVAADDSTPETEEPVSRIQSLDVPTSNVTLTVRSTNRSIANTLPADATWTVSVDGTPIATDTFAASDLSLPRAIAVDDAVPYGTYMVTISAGPIFQPFSQAYTVDSPSEGFDVPLDPVTDSAVTISVTSSNPSAANTLPVDATWSVSSGGNPVDADTFAADDLALPASIPVTARVPFGSYDVTISAGPTFRPFSTTLVVDNVSESFTIVLQPFTWTDVSFTVSSSDPSVDNTLPSGAVWSIRTVNDVQLAQGTFAADNLDMPATIDVVPLIPFGTYKISVGASPQFADFTGTFVFNSTTEMFNITLIPSDADFITQLIAQLIAILTAILAGQV
jgi:hypothetical protein